MSLRDVVVIGGGLSGLVAANELEKAGINYTIIEVKPRFGGSIKSDSHDGFTLDSGTMIHQVRNRESFGAYLTELGLDDAIETVDEGIIFKHGTGAFIDSLAGRLNAPRMMRMAVSTLGEMYGAKRFSICMENGMFLDSRALIVASPARYAERMFHTLTPEISYKLLDYRYENIVRVSFGYRRADVPTIPTAPPQHSPITFIHSTTLASRVPDDGVLIQVGVHFDAKKGIPADIVNDVIQIMNWTSTPLVTQVGAWSEADPIMWQMPNHLERLRDINGLLPDGVALIGSDYIPTNDSPRLDERIALAKDSARKIIAWMK